MTSPTNSSLGLNHNKQQSNEVEKQITAALDSLNDNLSDKVLTDIAQVREKALTSRQETNQQTISFRLASLINSLISHLTLKVSLPLGVAAALLITLTYNNLNLQQIPEIPLAMTTTNMPSEDITLLQDLEFIQWLAEHEQEI